MRLGLLLLILAVGPAAGQTPASANPFRQLFYDNDFGHLDNPESEPIDAIDRLKRLRLGPDATLELGGEYRARHHHEVNLRLDGRSNDFLLHRTRLYAHARHGDWLEGYVEFLDAASSFERLQPRATEVNRADLLNLFVQPKLRLGGGHTLAARAGRQEMTLGSQRLVSNRPWRNAPLTFDGVRLLYDGPDVAATAFWLRPIDHGLNPQLSRTFDVPDPSQQFFGLFASMSPAEGHTAEAFYFGLVETAALTAGGEPGPFDTHTFGGRWQGEFDDWLWEFEGGYQFGRVAGRRQSAGYFVTGGGYRFSQIIGTPTLWVFYDWASGDDDPAAGVVGTFNQHFPRGHFYLGQADIVGRRNLTDLNIRLTVTPVENVNVTVWYHDFHLQEARDALYSPAGPPARIDPTGLAGTDVGEEIDVIVDWDVTRWLNVAAGYVHFFSGSFLERTGNGDDADFVYLQLSARF